MNFRFRVKRLRFLSLALLPSLIPRLRSALQGIIYNNITLARTKRCLDIGSTFGNTAASDRVRVPSPNRRHRYQRA